MNTLLGIDTVSGGAIAVGIAAAGEVTVVVREAGFEHSRTLLSIVDELIGGDRGQVTAVVVTKGPGAYAGLRAGIATAQGIGLALGVPVIGVATLEAVAHAAGGSTLAVHPAGRGDYAAQPFENGAATSDPRIATADELARTACAGEGAQEAGGTEITPEQRCRAALKLGQRQLEQGGADDFEPFYLREPNITAPRRSRMSGAANHS